jgi:hypothetical protein
MLGSNQRSQREFPIGRTRSTTRPTIVQTGGAIDTSPDRLPLDHALTVGRQAMPGQVVLDHPNVSRRHAAFEVADGNIVLRDLGAPMAPMSTAHGCAALVPWSRGTASISAHSN